MGFLEDLGKHMGRVAAQVDEMHEYESEYEQLSDRELREEYNSLKENPKRSKYGHEIYLRFQAVQKVLKSRRGQ
jgi:preprotein translocase subunit SecA